jgi:hypothetical protein
MDNPETVVFNGKSACTSSQCTGLNYIHENVCVYARNKLWQLLAVGNENINDWCIRLY